jgi:phosphate uptake regulator
MLSQMEYRKLISFGKNSFVVSLPKNWVRQNKLVKGDLIYIDEHGPHLTLSNKARNTSDEEKEKIILIDGKTEDRIQREVRAAYLLNFRKITLKGQEIKTNIKPLQQIFQSLIALEVMEQTSDTIIAKDFLNMKKVSVQELLHKMDIVTRAMFSEACSSFSKEIHENLQERDKDVNRLYYLLYRAALYNLDNPMTAMKNFKMTSIDITNYILSSFYLEGVADEVRRTARYTHEVKVSEAEKKLLQTYLIKVHKFYLEVMKTLYSRDEDKAFKLAKQKKDLNEELDRFYQRNRAIEHADVMVHRMRKLLSHIHNLVRVVYHGFNYQEQDKETLLR